MNLTDKQLKLIYEYMGWEVCSGKLYPCPRCNPTHYEMKDYDNPLDSNSAWECVQEMYRKDDLELFYYNTHNLCDEATRLNHAQFQLWLMNPTNFFNCFVKFLEVKHES